MYINIYVSHCYTSYHMSDIYPNLERKNKPKKIHTNAEFLKID